MLKGIIIGAALLAAYGMVGSMDLQHEKQQAEQYAKMVCAGAWPDYENRKPECD